MVVTDNLNAGPSLQAKEDISHFAPFQAPSIYCSGLQAALVGNDAFLTLLAPLPVIRKSTGQPAEVAVLHPVGVINLSLRTLKDMHEVIGSVISAFEQEWGTIQTDYTRSADKTKVG
jgi:hypothetical protein